MTLKIGFLGLGTMGLAMAGNLLRAGYPVRAWNRSADAVAAWVRQGGQGAASPGEAVQDAEVVISMLADDAATRSVVVEGGVLAAMAPGAIHANMATVSLALARELATLHGAAGHHYVAAPVLGRVNVAEAGKLNILAAGESAALARLAPLFAVLGQKTWVMGEQPEQANVAKLAANFMIAAAIEAMGEAAALVQGHGVAREDFLAMVTQTVFAVPAYQGYGAAIAGQHFEPPGFKLRLGLKDVALAQAAGDAARIPLPLASLLKDNHLDSLAHGEGDWDWAALARVAARRAGQG